MNHIPRRQDVKNYITNIIFVPHPRPSRYPAATRTLGPGQKDLILARRKCSQRHLGLHRDSRPHTHDHLALCNGGTGVRQHAEQQTPGSIYATRTIFLRHYGLLANAGRRENLARARELLHVTPKADAEYQDEVAPVGFIQPAFVCQHCGAAMKVVEILMRGQPPANCCRTLFPQTRHLSDRCSSSRPAVGPTHTNRPFRPSRFAVQFMLNVSIVEA